MRSHRSILLTLAALTAALALAACGGDDGGGDEDEVSETIEQAATSTDPADCTGLATQAFLEQTEFSTGEEAVTACEEDTTPTADSVDVAEVEVDGDSATAEASFSGGGLDGQTLALSLVNEGDQWKLDRIDEFVDFDQEAFAAGLRAEIGEDEGAPQQVVDCVVEQVSAADPNELQAAYLSGDENQLVSIFGACFEG